MISKIKNTIKKENILKTNVSKTIIQMSESNQVQHDSSVGFVNGHAEQCVALMLIIVKVTLQVLLNIRLLWPQY